MSEQTQPSDVEQKIESMHNAFSRYLRASDKSSKDQSLADILRHLAIIKCLFYGSVLVRFRYGESLDAVGAGQVHRT